MILAGGLGMRLRAVVADRPKPMAEVAGRPFITFLLDHLSRHAFQRAVLCVGHMGDYVPAVLGHKYGSLELVYSFEPAPLGTGGALQNAAKLIHEHDVLAMNGDSFCDIDLSALDRVHRSCGGAATLAVLWQSDRRRSGAVTVDGSGRVVGFESRPSLPTPGLINAGVYMLRRDRSPSSFFFLLHHLQ
jgi:NDP-sugar pyrophosphorylase family protein